MTLIATTAAVVLAAVLVWAAAAKLRSPNKTTKDFASLGLRQARTLTWAIPGAELTVAALLVVRPLWGGLAAAALLVAFSTIILRVLRAPEEFGSASCACFGGASHQPLSALHLWRNVVLFVLAVLATFARGL